MGNRSRDGLQAVTVIMPTLARGGRALRMQRAVSSILAQSNVDARVLVVVNGTEYDQGLVERITQLDGVSVTSIPEPHQGEAIRHGRNLITTPFFAELDDDDVLLPGTLARAVARLRDSDAAAAVSNGWIEGCGNRRALIDDVAATAADPLAALEQISWLASGGAVFRTDRVEQELFDGLPRYLEWTCLALRLARSYPLEFLDDFGFVHFEGYPDSVWQSPECVLGRPAAIRQLLAGDMPQPLREVFTRRLRAAYNAAAIQERSRGRLAAAWRWHWQCLMSGGWRFLPFTRQLLRASNGRVGA